ncbi:MAG: hypothetical protein HC877_23495 [Thioploca sp.]|nr:hypothetical protein [Thioploca sp.]
MKQKYLITIEAIAPIIVEFEVYASDPEEAFNLIDKSPHLYKPRKIPQIFFNKMSKKYLQIKNMFNSKIEIKKIY